MYSSDQEVSEEAVVVEQGEHNPAKAEAAEVVEVTEAVVEEHEGVGAEEDGSFLCSRHYQDGWHHAVLLDTQLADTRPKQPTCCTSACSS